MTTKFNIGDTVYIPVIVRSISIEGSNNNIIYSLKLDPGSCICSGVSTIRCADEKILTSNANGGTNNAET